MNLKHNDTGEVIASDCHLSLPIVVRYKYEQTEEDVTHTVAHDKNNNWLLIPLSKSPKKGKSNGTK